VEKRKKGREREKRVRKKRVRLTRGRKYRSPFLLTLKNVPETTNTFKITRPFSGL
jgi:hypothetical protein